MAKWKQTVGAILDDMGLSTVAAEEVRVEVRRFRERYAKDYHKNLKSADMQNPDSDDVKEMAHTYFEKGLPQKRIRPGRSRWTADVSAAQTGQPEYPIPQHRILELLQKLIAHQNWNTDRNWKYVASKKETSSPVSSDSEQNYAVGPTRGRGPYETRSRLRSSALHSDEGSTEYSQVAPVARMEPSFGSLPRTGRYTYGGQPDIVDLDTHDDQETMTSASNDESGPMRDDHHSLSEAGPTSISADAENHLSGLADPSSAFDKGLGNTGNTAHQQSPTKANNSDFQQCTQQSNLRQTTTHKRRVGEDETPQSESTRNSPSWETVNQNTSIDKRTKRRCLKHRDSIQAPPPPNSSRDSNNSDIDHLEAPTVDTHQSNISQAATKPPDNGANCLRPKERLPTTENQMPSVPNQIREQEQVDQGPGDSKVGLQLSAWLLDPRKPGGCLKGWPGNKPLSHSVYYIFEKTTELLETDGYSGIEFLFKLNNKAREVIFQVTKNAPEEFEIMKENAPRKLKEIMIESGKKATAIDITLRPVGLTQVGSSESASAATVEDEDLYGIDALFE